MVGKANHKTWSEKYAVSELVKKLQSSPFEISFAEIVTTPIIISNGETLCSLIDDTFGRDLFNTVWDDFSGRRISDKHLKKKHTVNKVAIIHDVCITTKNSQIGYQKDATNWKQKIPILTLLLRYLREKQMTFENGCEDRVLTSSNRDSPYVVLGEAFSFYRIGEINYSFESQEQINSNIAPVHSQAIPISKPRTQTKKRVIKLLEQQRIIVFPSEDIAIAYKEYSEWWREIRIVQWGPGFCKKPDGSKFALPVGKGWQGRTIYEPLFDFSGEKKHRNATCVLKPVFLHSLGLPFRKGYSSCVREYDRRFAKKTS